MTNYKIPSDICKEAKDYVKDVLQRLEESGVLENVDTAALDMLARNYSMFIGASKQIEREGATITNVQGNIVKHPAVTIAKDAQVQVVKIMQEFGLTAKARTKLPKLDKKEEEDSPLETFVKTAKEVR
ncbi:MAG: phage terminase small subunit P27 family [Firmicutes bacterium]|nr:phage terminase small subunit P27 family [Bacillota bacterium]